MIDDKKLDHRVLQSQNKRADQDMYDACNGSVFPGVRDRPRHLQLASSTETIDAVSGSMRILYLRSTGALS